MKIAISASSPSLDSEVNPRFGRCKMFIIANPESMDFETIDNAGESAGGGAGIATAQMITQKGVEAVITGNCGPNAHKVLTAAGIKIITGANGTVREAIEDYKSGKFSA
ncbi:MAG: NifB/NifX family molybdenum-iron cluster-binding protein, partial [Dehalococcoidales bacterium]|nr:NifB/NifX family molybdenum-iron cluster-binding protein [Dehalococcoidales bacterium]